ncbi:protein PsiE [Bacillus fengqiuensis]|nr:protein PsiE [Bacillus fengqiuensis]
MMRDTWRITSPKTIFEFSKLPAFRIAVPSILQFILNAALIILATVLCILMAKEVFHFVEFIGTSEATNIQHFLEQILVFFLYFEFISMIVKYFRENYHFPMRYFLYIGITAMIRLIIVDHDNPFNTLLHAFVILILTLSYYIINKTPSRKSFNNK